MCYTHTWEQIKTWNRETMSLETPSLIDNFPPNTLLATLQELLPYNLCLSLTGYTGVKQLVLNRLQLEELEGKLCPIAALWW